MTFQAQELRRPRTQLDMPIVHNALTNDMIPPLVA